MTSTGGERATRISDTWTEAQRWWPGLFRPLVHEVDDDARGIPLSDGNVYTGVCGALCWDPNRLSLTGYAPCPTCADSVLAR